MEMEMKMELRTHNVEFKQSDQELQQHAETARRLLMEATNAARRETTVPGPGPAPMPELTPDQRLAAIHEFASDALSHFQDLDTTDNDFIGTHELGSANKPGTSYLLSREEQIKELHFDYVRTDRRRWIDTNHLGMSTKDLEILKSATSDNPFELRDFERERYFHTGGGKLSLLGVGTSLLSGIALSYGYRAGLIGLGISLGAIALGWAMGQREHNQMVEGIRDQYRNDPAIDYYAWKAQKK